MRPRCTVSHTKSDIFEDNILADMASHMVRGVSQGMQNCLDAYSTDPPTTTRRPELGAGNGRGIGAGDDQEESVETHGHALLAAFALEESGAYQLPQKRVSGVSGLSPWRRSANPIICLGVLPRHGKNFWGRWWPRGPRPANPPSRYELVRNTMVDSNLRHVSLLRAPGGTGSNPPGTGPRYARYSDLRSGIGGSGGTCGGSDFS
jgi:hypothetical protein